VPEREELDHKPGEVDDYIDAALLREAGFDVRAEENRTKNMAEMAGRWAEVRQQHEADLRSIEGARAFEGQREFFRVASALAAEGRLSRFAYLAVKE
jgi:hypothetical protein